jgi:hypothetical protein
MAYAARSKPLALSAEAQVIADAVKLGVNGVLEHELNVGDAAFVQFRNKIPIPFAPDAQYHFSRMNGASHDQAVTITVARMGALAYWAVNLGSVDKDESFDKTKFYTVLKPMKTAAGIEVNIVSNGVADGERYVEDKNLIFNENEWATDFSDLRMIANGLVVSLETLFLHMKDVAMLVGMNLVKTGHHYQTAANGAFRALERKRWGREILSDDVRGIVYHEALHPFTQASKLVIYSAFLAQKNAGNITGTYLLLDPTVLKRVPVVPAGGAWLSAGVSIMNELVGIPMIKSNIPKDYLDLLVSARAAVATITSAGVITGVSLAEFEALASFAYGVLKEIAPTHSATKAPSLNKMADAHIGAKEAGANLGRAAIRGELSAPINP